MRNAITGILVAGATSALLATSAFAQVAGNPGDLHTQPKLAPTPTVTPRDRVDPWE
jgi:hypothetical protein